MDTREQVVHQSSSSFSEEERFLRNVEIWLERVRSGQFTVKEAMTHLRLSNAHYFDAFDNLPKQEKCVHGTYSFIDCFCCDNGCRHNPD